jgi:hypothetical protein
VCRPGSASQPPVALHLWVDFYPVSSIALNVSSRVSDSVTRATLDVCVSSGEWYHVSRLLSAGQGILGRLAEPIDRTFATHPEPQLDSAFTRALPDIKYTVTCATPPRFDSLARVRIAHSHRRGPNRHRLGNSTGGGGGSGIVFPTTLINPAISGLEEIVISGSSATSVSFLLPVRACRDPLLR